METGIVRLPAGISRVKKSDLLLPTGYKTILTGDNLLAKRARTYLKSRGFDLNYMDRIGVGYCDESHDDFKKNFFGYIIIPFKKRGLLSYFIGRDFIGNFPRYKNPETAEFSVGKADVLFNEEAIYLETKIYLTEGWADAATLGRAGISMQGSTPSTIQKNNIIKSDVEQVVVVPDAKFFMNGLQTARDFISYKKVKVLNMDKFLEYGKKDVNEVGYRKY
jgi:DNA primase